MNMEKMERLKRNICEELEMMAEKPLSGSSLDTIDKLAHAGKNVCKLIEMGDGGEYSGAMWRADGSYGEPMSYRRGYSRTGYMDGGSSYRRDSMGRYSRDGGKDNMMRQLEEMMQDATSISEKNAIQRCIDSMRNG